MHYYIILYFILFWFLPIFQIVIQEGNVEDGMVHIRTADDHRARFPCPIKYLHDV